MVHAGWRSVVGAAVAAGSGRETPDAPSAGRREPRRAPGDGVRRRVRRWGPPRRHHRVHCPGVDGRLVRAAFTALGRRDVVLGPARDGGYYLIGLAAPEPALFRGIAWSTAVVAVETRARARALGLSCHLLRRLRDVAPARDAR